jgi:hypothetical protein
VTIVRDVVQDLIKKGKTLAQIKEANPAADYAPRYGSDSQFIDAIYQSLTGKKQ